MKIWVGGGEKIFILSTEGSSLPKQDMPLDAMRIKLGTKQILLIVLSKACSPILHQPGWSNARKFGHDRHQITRTLEFVHGWVPLGIDAPFYEVHQSVSLTVLR